VKVFIQVHRHEVTQVGLPVQVSLPLEQPTERIKEPVRQR
jgi:hypothetical protein